MAVHRGHVARPGSLVLALGAVANAVGAGILLYRFLRLWPWIVDDSFIAFRYARHLAAGQGLRWNIGEPPVEGFTSVLWVALTAVPHLLHVDVTAFAKLVSLAAVIAAAGFSAAIVWELLRDADDSVRRVFASAVALVVTAHPMTAVHASSGMETGVFAGLTSAFVYVAVHYGLEPRSRTTGLLSALALLLAMARPDGVLLAVVVLAGLTVAAPARGRSAAWIVPLVAGFGLPGAVYFVARWAAFGLPLPLPFYVKSSGGWEGVGEVVGFYCHAVGWLCLPAALGMVLWAKRLWPTAIGLALHSVFYMKPVHTMGFSWRYLFPYFPFLVAAAGLGVFAALRSRPRLAVAGATLGALAAAVSYGRGAAAEIDDHLAYARGLQAAHVRLGRELGALQERIGGARLRLVVSDAGAVPYYSDWRVLDSYGLNDRTIALSGRRENAYVYATNPDAVVVISRLSMRIAPRLAWEAPIAAEAQRRGYVAAAVYEFGAPRSRPYGGYYLWLLLKPELRALMALE